MTESASSEEAEGESEDPAQRSIPATPGSRRALVLAAFGAVYVIWGSTYLAIRVGVETLPPFLMAGTRFLSAGVVLYAFLRLRGARRPTALDWKRAAISGLLMLAAGNGLVTWAETSVPSNVAALLVAGTPCYLAFLDWVRPEGVKPTRSAAVGIGLGLVGMLLMVGAGADERGGAGGLGVVAVLAAGFSWAAGTLYARYRPGPGHRGLATAQQMMAGGLALVLVGLASGESARDAIVAASARSVIALVYLSVFGSLVAFSAYGYLVRMVTPVRLSTIAYVNPVIAVILGWALLDEGLGPRVIAGAAIILGGVAAMTLMPAAGRRSG